MAESSGVSEAGKAWITISVNDEATAGLEQVSRSLESFSASAQTSVTAYDAALEKTARDSAQHWKNIADSCNQAGEVLSAAFNKFAAPTKEAVGVFSEFDDMMRAVSSKISGATAKDLEHLTDKAQQLGKSMSFTATEVAEGMKLLAQNGFNASEIDKSIKPVMNLARATGTDVASAADIASTALRSFNLDAGQMERVCDVLAATSNSSAQSLTDIGYAIGFSASNAANAGSSLEDYMKLLGTLANFGQKGSKGGTALRKILTSSVSPRNSDKFIDLGISPVDENGQLKQTAELIGEVQQKIKDMGSGEQAQWLYSLFGSTGMTGGANLMKGSFEAMETAIDNAGGTAQRTADAMDAGLGGSTRIMLSAFEALKIAVGDSLAPTMQSLADSTTTITAGIAEWVKHNQDLVAGVAEAVTALGALGFALTATGTTILAVQKAAALWGPAMTAFSIATKTAGTAASVLGKAFFLLEAHPIVALLSLAAAAAGAVGLKMYLASRETKRYSDSAKELREANDQRRASDEAAIERLKQLEQQQKLSSDEFAEAQQILLDLSYRYKDLGIQADAASKSISGASEAQRKMLEIHHKERLYDIDKEMKEAEENQKKAAEDATKHSRYGGKEFTLEEIEEMGRKAAKRERGLYGGRPISDEQGAQEFKDRAVLNKATGKFRLVDENAYKATGWMSSKKGLERAKRLLAEELETEDRENLRLQGLKTEKSILTGEEAKEETGSEAAPETGATAAEPTTQSTPTESPQPAPPAPNAEPIPATTTPAEGATAEEVPAELLAPVELPQASGWEQAGIGALPSSDALDEELNGLQNALDGAGTASGNLAEQSVAAAEALEQAKALQEESNRQNQAAQQQGAEMQQSVADWKNGPGSASYQRMDITDKAIVDTAENTKITADYVKKLYDLLKANGGQAVFAQ